MKLTSYFADFLKEIRPTDAQTTDCQTGHITLRDRINKDEDLSKIIVGTFLQGSYRRFTMIRPKEQDRADVDVIVVTNLDRSQYPDPGQAMDLFVPFLDKHYKNIYKKQGRSFGIELSYVSLDLVITSAPSESQAKLFKSKLITAGPSFDQIHGILEANEETWKNEPLWIPDREAKVWQPTHPLAQIDATIDKNKASDGHYVNVVKAIKWWRREKQPKTKYPKSYPLEHLIWSCCPNKVDSVAEGVTLALEIIASRYQSDAYQKRTPYLRDHGVEQNVLGRIRGEDFALFHEKICQAAKIARKAFDEEDTNKSAELWRQLFGDKFPAPPPGNSSNPKGGFTKREDVSKIGGPRFAQW